MLDRKIANKILSLILTVSMVLTISGPTLSFAADGIKDAGNNRISIERISGQNRYQTAIEISKYKTKISKNKTRDTVIIASGENFADALSGGGLAAILDTTILLTKKNKIENDVLNEIKRLGAKKIYIIGGMDSISHIVEEQLKKIATVKRIAGSDRFQTSVLVKDEMEKFGASKKYGYVNGNIYPDALSAVAYLAKQKSPLILTNGKHLPKGDLDIKDCIIFGGENSINIRELKGKRISGKDRYETSQKIAQEGFSSVKTAVVVDGTNYPDALASISIAKEYNAPIILLGKKTINDSVKKYFNNLSKVIINGGEDSVSKDIENKIKGIINKEESQKPSYRPNDSSSSGSNTEKPGTGKPETEKPGKDKPNDNDLVISIDKEEPDNKKNDEFKTLSDKLDLKVETGSANIKKISYTQVGSSEKETKGELKKNKDWVKNDIPLEIGYNDFVIKTEYKDGKIKTEEVQALRLSEEVGFKDNVKDLSKSESDKLGDKLITYYKYKENNETVYAIIAKKHDFKYKKNEIIVIEPTEKIPTGLTIQIKETGKVTEVKGKINKNENKGLDTFNDIDYMVIYATKPDQSEVYDGNVAMMFDKVDKENPIAFIYTPNGTSIEYSSGNESEEFKLNNSGHDSFYGKNIYTAKKLQAIKRSNNTNDIENKKGFQKDAIKNLIDSRKVEASPSKLALKFGESILWDDDGDKETKNDQVKISGKFELNDIKVQQDYILPQQVYGKISYNKVANAKLSTGAKIDIKDIVNDINKSVNGGYENKIEFFGGEIEGVDMNDKIILCTVGINLNSVAVGNLNTIKPLSKAPILIVSLYIDMYGELKASASIDYNYKAYIEDGANIQKKNKKFKHGRGVKDDEKYNNIYDDGKYVVDVYNTVGRSEKEKNEQPLNEIVATANGKALYGLGIGIQSGVMLSGLVPFIVYMGLTNEMAASFDGSFGYDFNKKAWKDVKVKGNVVLKYLAKTGAAIKLKLKGPSGNNLLDINKKVNNEYELFKVPKDFTNDVEKYIEDMECYSFEYRVMENNEVEITGFKRNKDKDIGIYYERARTIEIPSKIKGMDVTSIGNRAFKHKDIWSVKLPKAIKSIGEEAFSKNCLNEINLPDTISFIGKGAFEKNLIGSLSIPRRVTKISENAFSENCLSSVVLPDNITSIGENAFADNNLTSLIFPNKLKEIGNRAFCRNALTSLSIPEGVTRIGIYAFNDNSITSVSLPNSLKTIEHGIFQKNCLTSISIPEGVTSIGGYAFYDNNLSNLSLPEGLLSIGTAAFYRNSLSKLTIPGSVTEIDMFAFQNNRLTSLSLQEGIKIISWHAFQENCLTEISIPNSVSHIAPEAFYNNLIGEMSIPKHIRDNINWVYYFMDRRVEKEDNQVSEDDFEYKVIDNNEIEITGYKGNAYDMVIPDSIGGKDVTSIGPLVFYKDRYSYKSRLRSVILPKNLKSIGESAFDGNKLTSLSLPEGVTNIGRYAFFGNRLTGLSLPEGITSIGPHAFAGNKLSSLSIPEGITKIGWGAFAGNKLTSLKLPKGMPIIEDGTFKNNYLTDLIIPEDVTEIRYEAFSHNKLTSVSFPNSLKRIDTRAFFENNLSSIYLPKNLDYLGDKAFTMNRCNYVEGLSTVKEEGDFVFDGNIRNNGRVTRAWEWDS